MNEQWYCPNCGPTETGKWRRNETFKQNECLGCEADLLIVPPFVLAMQKHIAELEKENTELRLKLRAGIDIEWAGNELKQGE